MSVFTDSREDRTGPTEEVQQFFRIDYLKETWSLDVIVTGCFERNDSPVELAEVLLTRVD